jgi:hypothetical protein
MSDHLQKILNTTSKTCLQQEKKIFESNPGLATEKYLKYDSMNIGHYVDQLFYISRAFAIENELIEPNTWNQKKRIKNIINMMQSFDGGKGYQLNIDNFIKISLILQKARNGLPVIIMGETGCGKTYLVQFIVEVILYGVAILKLKTMHFGVTKAEFIEFVTDGIEEAQNNPNKVIWLFFDEFNTSKLQSYINQMMHEREFLLSPKEASPEKRRQELPKNLILVSVCNPYQIKAINQDRAEEIINAHPDKINILSHQVLPIPSRMLYGLWDFGALQNTIEAKYINSILKDLELTDILAEVFSEAINRCQEFIRVDVEHNNSSVSLRDIQRVKDITQFYIYLLLFRETFKDNDKLIFDDFCIKASKIREQVKNKIKIKAFIVSLYINYVYRIFSYGKSYIYIF